jgi:hypothetical protein
LSRTAADSSSVAFFALEGRPKFMNLSNPPNDHALAWRHQLLPFELLRSLNRNGG